MIAIKLILLLVLAVTSLPSRYHHYDEMTRLLEEISNSEQCSNITNLYSIGKSVHERELWVLEFEKPGTTIKPSVKVVGNIHGNEAVGREVAIRLCQYLCSNIDHWLLDNTRIAILPSMNPDGFERAHRTNGHFVDLNRNFPDQFKGQPTVIEPEVEAVMNWSLQQKFTLSLTFHGGSLVANYPYDGSLKTNNGEYSASPDDELFQDLALAYSTQHTRMYESDHFDNGITNGAAWYVLYGGMQDWNYLYANTFDVTVEISNRKWPPETELESYWQENRDAILNYISRVHIGVRGRISPDDYVWIRGIENHTTEAIVRDGKDTEYIRLLKPGRSYTIHCSNNKTTQVTIKENGKRLVRHDFI